MALGQDVDRRPVCGFRELLEDAVDREAQCLELLVEGVSMVAEVFLQAFEQVAREVALLPFPIAVLLDFE